MFARLVQRRPDGGGRWLLHTHAERAALSEAACVAQGFHLLTQTLDLGDLTAAEAADLSASLCRPAARRDRDGQRGAESALLARCPRLDAPGIDLDHGVVRYAVTWPGGEVAVDVGRHEARDLALAHARLVAAEEARRGVALRMAWSGGPERAGMHLEWGPCAPGVREPELLRLLHARAVDLAASVAVPTSATVADACLRLLLDRRQRLSAPFRVESSPQTAVGALRDGKAKTVTLALREPPADPTAELAALRAALPPVWLDLSPLAHGAGGRGRMWRPLGAQHKSGALKVIVDVAPDAATWSITAAMLEPYRSAARSTARAVASPATTTSSPRTSSSPPPAALAHLTATERAALEAARAEPSLAQGHLSHEGALALGNVVRLAGGSEALARALADRYADPSRAAERARVAARGWAQAADRAAAGGALLGWGRLRSDLGDGALEAKAILTRATRRPRRALVPGAAPTPPRAREPLRAVVPTRARVTPDEHARWLLEALTDPHFGAWVDRAPTGEGKSHHACEAAVRAASLGERIVVSVASHAFGEELLGVLVAARTRLLAAASPEDDGVARAAMADVTIARVPPIVCSERREEAYRATAARGWNPRAAVCRVCPLGPRPGGVPPTCAWLLGVEEAWRARIVVAQHAHLTTPDAWDGKLATRTRVILEEDPTLDVEAALEEGEAPRAADALRGLAFHEAANAAALEDRRGAVRRRVTSDARAGVANAALAALAALEGARVAGEDSVDVTTPVDLAPLLGDVDGVEEALRQELTCSRTNPIPLVVGLARAQRDGEPLRCLCRLHPTTRRVGLLALLPRPPVSGVGLLALNATQDLELIRGRLRRGTVQVLDAAPSRPTATIVQVTGRGWSRAALTRTGGIERAGELAAEIARRVGARRIGLVTHAPHLERLGAEVVAARAARGDDVEVVGRHFGALRGTNALADVDVLLIVGTPVPSAVAVRARAAQLGVPAREVASARRTEHGWDDPREAPGTRSRALQSIERRLVAEELAQATGRGLRGQRTPRGGVWILSSADLDADGLLHDERWLAPPEALGLTLSAERWDAAAAHRGASAVSATSKSCDDIRGVFDVSAVIWNEVRRNLQRI